jgi:peptide/nickel transport system permease protein
MTGVMPVALFVARKIVGLVAVLFVVSILVYFLGRGVAPGDVGTVIVGVDGATPAQIAHVRHELGLDRPIYIAYLKWASRAVRLDLGRSPISQLSVRSQLAQELPVSLELAVLAIVVTTLIGVPLGVVAATHTSRFMDAFIRVTLLTVFSIPVFLSGIVFLYIGAKYFGGLYHSVYVPISANLFGNLESMTLPTLAIALPTSAMTMQMTRSAMLEALAEPHVAMARAKGVRLWRIRYLHALKNALPAVLTLQGFLLGLFLGGLVLVEDVFSLPGLGRGIVTAIGQRDFQMLMPQVLVIAAFFVLSNTLVEIAHPFIDKRLMKT